MTKLDRLLFVTPELQYSNSSAAIRNRLLVEGLSEYYAVDVLEIIRDDKKNKTTDLSQYISTYFSIECIRTTKANDAQKSFIRKLKKFVIDKVQKVIPDKVYLLRDSLPNNLNVKEYQVVFSSSDPKGIHKYVCNEIYKVTDAVKVQYWGDPWYDDLSFGSGQLVKFLENRILSKSDIVLYNSIATLERQKKLYPLSSDKMFCLPRGVSSFSLANARAKRLAIPTGIPNNVRALYAGDYHSNIRNLQNLVKACEDLDLPLAIYGEGCELKTSSPAVSINSRVSKSELEEISESYNLDVIVLNRHGGQLPGKIYDSLISDRHVLVLLDGEFSEKDIPLNDRFTFCKNDVASIKAVFSTRNNHSGELFSLDEIESVNITSLLSPICHLINNKRV